MARQRFIWPSIWSDKCFGELNHEEQILFIGLYSLADDEGRIIADPKYLKAQIFPYKHYSAKRVERVRNRVVERMRNVRLYRYGAAGDEAIVLLKWADYQKPKYPKPSKIPPPLPEDSGNVPESFPHRVGLGREGLGVKTKPTVTQPEARPHAAPNGSGTGGTLEPITDDIAAIFDSIKANR